MKLSNKSPISANGPVKRNIKLYESVINKIDAISTKDDTSPMKVPSQVLFFETNGNGRDFLKKYPPIIFPNRYAKTSYPQTPKITKIISSMVIFEMKIEPQIKNNSSRQAMIMFRIL